MNLGLGIDILCIRGDDEFFFVAFFNDSADSILGESFEVLFLGDAL